MKKNLWIIIFLIVILFVSCQAGRKQLTDYYEITWGDYYTQGREGYCIGCEIRGESDSIVQNIKSIRWNDRIIIIEKNTLNDFRWFAFIANGDKLSCGNNDKLIGPLSQYQVDSLINHRGFTDLKEDIFFK